MQRSERVRGGVYGLLVGDALGVPYEFHPARAIPPLPEIEMTPPPGFRRAHATVPPGTWSDDGAQALVLLESLLRMGRLDVTDLADGLLRWRDEGRYAADGRVFDIGIQTTTALDRFRRGTPADRAGSTESTGNGNGSLMRVLPLALWHRGSDAELAADAMVQSLPTHGHVRSHACCALYCLWARRIRDGMPPGSAWGDARHTFEGLYPLGHPAREEVEAHVFPRGAVYRIRGGGYVVESLRAAVHLCAHDDPLDYEQIVKAAIALGDDTDTTACIAGGIAGLAVGERGLPDRWRQALRGHDLVEPLLAALVAGQA